MAFLASLIKPKHVIFALITFFVVGSLIAGATHYFGLKADRDRFQAEASELTKENKRIRDINKDNLVELTKLRDNARDNARARAEERRAEQKRIKLLEKGLQEISNVQGTDGPIDPWLASVFRSLRDSDPTGTSHSD